MKIPLISSIDQIRSNQQSNSNGLGRILARLSGVSFLIITFAALTSGLSKIILVRVLGVESYGMFAYASSWAAFLTIISLYGYDIASTRFISVYTSLEQWELLRGFITRSFISVIATTTIAMLIFSSVIFLLRQTLEVNLVVTFWVAALLLPVDGLLKIVSTYLLALRKIIMAQAPAMIVRSLLLLGILLALALLKVDLTASEAMLLYVVITAVILVVSLWYLRETLPSLVFQVKAQTNTQEWNKVARHFSGMTITRQLMARSDIILIGLFLGTTQAGIYSVVLLLMLVVDNGMQAINNIASPMISELYAANNRNHLDRLAMIAAYGSFGIALIFFVIYVFLGSFALGLFGNEFIEAYPTLLFVMIGRLIHSSTGAVNAFLNMTGHEKETLNVILITAVATVSANIVLIPAFGLVGAGIASIIMFTIQNFLLAIRVKNTIYINPTIFRLDQWRLLVNMKGN